MALGDAAQLLARMVDRAAEPVEPLLFRVPARDPVVFGGVVVVVLVVAVAASLVPAWRATRVDPASALRAE
jgi:ABC-type lipoprotein release transport system permease subunit